MSVAKNFFKFYYRLRAGTLTSRLKILATDCYLFFLDSRFKLLKQARSDKDLVRCSELLDELYRAHSGNVVVARYLLPLSADLGLTEMAHSLGICYLKSVIRTDINVFLNDIRLYITPILGNVSVDYNFSGGNENIGSIICKSTDGHILSFGKIIPMESYSSREVEFYKSFIVKHPSLKSKVPEIYCVYDSPYRVSIIFMQPLNQEGFLKKRIGRPVVSINSIIESISYSDVKQFFSEIHLDYSKPFGRIFHLRTGCRYAMSEIQLGFSKTPSPEVHGILLSLEMVFLHSHAYRLIDLEDHYSLCHNDFNWRNIHFENEVCKVYDWTTFSIGLRGWDMAIYFSDCAFTFSEIYDLYITVRFDLTSRKDQIGLLFFCFSLLLNIARRERGNCNSKLDGYFKPALRLIQDTHKRINGGRSGANSY